MNNRPLSEIIGPEALRILSHAKGGQRVRIPSRECIDTHPGHWLPELIGDVAARALAWECAGIAINVPTLKQERIQATHAAIVAGLAAGESAETMAAIYGYTWRHVYRIAAAAKVAGVVAGCNPKKAATK